jgi:hypothetical protein
MATTRFPGSLAGPDHVREMSHKTILARCHPPCSGSQFRALEPDFGKIAGSVRYRRGHHRGILIDDAGFDQSFQPSHKPAMLRAGKSFRAGARRRR